MANAMDAIRHRSRTTRETLKPDKAIWLAGPAKAKARAATGTLSQFNLSDNDNVLFK